MFDLLKAVYLAWQSKGENPGWFPIGRLEVSGNLDKRFTFSYTKGALIALKRQGFHLWTDFRISAKPTIRNLFFRYFTTV